MIKDQEDGKFMLIKAPYKAQIKVYRLPEVTYNQFGVHIYKPPPPTIGQRRVRGLLKKVRLLNL